MKSLNVRHRLIDAGDGKRKAHRPVQSQLGGLAKAVDAPDSHLADRDGKGRGRPDGNVFLGRREGTDLLAQKAPERAQGHFVLRDRQGDLAREEFRGHVSAAATGRC